MAGFAAEIIARRTDTVSVRVPAVSCSPACACTFRRRQTTVQLPAAPGAELRISLSLRNLCVLLLNTLLFPLGGFMAGTILAQWMYADDMLAFVGSMLGFGMGLLACRKQSFDRVVIEEVSGNE